MDPSFLTKSMPEPSLTSLPQKAHFFGTYISGYRTPFFHCLWNLEYKGRAEVMREPALNIPSLSFNPQAN